RKINDAMGKYVAENTVKKMIKAHKQINGSKVAVFGVTFKENCPDVRNTKVVDIIRELEEYGIEVKVVDPVADQRDLWQEYGIKTYRTEEIVNIDAVIFAVPHDEFKLIKLDSVKKMFGPRKAGAQSWDEVAATFEGNHNKGRNEFVL